MGGRPDRDRLVDGRPGHPGRLNRPEHDPARSRRLRPAAGMDGQRLQPELRGAADHRRRARRPVSTIPVVSELEMTETDIELVLGAYEAFDLSSPLDGDL